MTVAAVLAAPYVVPALVRDPEQSQLATMLAYLLLPEIVFLTIAATVTAVLNVSDSYAPAAWAPVVNNGVVLAAAVGFVLLPVR